MERVFFMKKIIVLVFFVFFSVTGIVVGAEGGHPAFQQIIIPPLSPAKLLAHQSEGAKAAALKSVGWKLFGWSVFSLVENQKIEYVGETIFSRSNRTSLPITFKYQASESKMVERSVSTNSSAGLKLSGKVLGLNAGLDAAVKREVGSKERLEQLEKYEFSLTVFPKTKITVKVRGDARLNNGSCKYFFLGIAFKKGTWETIDIINAYYDFYEESI